MTVLPQHTQRIIFHKAMASAHLIAAEFDCSVSDVLDLLVTAPFTPSQPGASISHAPAAPTDGAAEPPVPTEPSVDLSELLHFSDQPEGGKNEVDPTALPAPGNAPEPDVRSTVSRPSGSGDFLQGNKSELQPPRRITNRQRVRECHEAHPDWTADQIAADTGLGAQQVRVIASQTSLKLPRPSPVKPQQAAEPPPAPEPAPESEQPLAVIPAAPLPPPAIKVMHSVKGRFYLRERTDVTGSPRFVHQSLQPCPTGPGPLMTSDRKWAWYDTMERFRGAVKKWPELAEMRKEAAAS